MHILSALAITLPRRPSPRPVPGADDAVRSAALVRSLVRAAIRVDRFTSATASELERSTADLMRGTKAVKRDLRRLRKVSQVFQP